MGINKLSGDTESYEACNLSKNTTASFHEKNEIQASDILEPLYLDIWRLAPVPSSREARYVLTIIVDYICYSFVYTLRNKDQAFQYFRNFKHFIERQMGKKIK